MIRAGRLAAGLLVFFAFFGGAWLGQSRAAGPLTAGDVLTTDVLTARAAFDRAKDVAIQTDGSTVVVGTSSCLEPWCDYGSIVRYDADGALDPSFGAGGILSGEASGLSEANAVAIQPDGAIVVGGVVGASGVAGEARGGKFGLARYLPDGSLDPSFGNGGVVHTEFCPEPAAGTVNDLAIQPDGRIVAVGSIRCDQNRAIAIARYLPDGELDPDFQKGWVAFNAPGRAHEELRAVALQADGKIVAVGGGTGKLLVIRLDDNGERDNSFGRNGFDESPVFADAIDPKVKPQRVDIRVVATAVAITKAGGIIVAGGKDGAENIGAVIAYRADGTADRGFGRRGFAPMPGIFPLSIARDRCGHFELAGRGSPSRGADVFAVAGLRADGARRKSARLVMPFGRGEKSSAYAITPGPGRDLTAVGGMPVAGAGEEFALSRLFVTGPRC
jgi:uncharacterized delta-60 repeat protein